MKQVLIIAALALPLLSACGDKEEQPYFQVLGEAKVERQPDLFRITFSVMERSPDKQKSFEAAADKLDQIRENLSQLDGVKKLRIVTGNARTDTVLPKGCYPERPEENEKYPEKCDPLEFISYVNMSVEGEPASAAGTVFSMLTQLKAEEVSVAGYGVKDIEGAMKEARRKAVENARDAARDMAEAAGARLGMPLEIKHGDEISNTRFKLGELDSEDQDTIIVTGSRIPARRLWLPPDTVDFSARVAVKFALEKPNGKK